MQVTPEKSDRSGRHRNPYGDVNARSPQDAAEALDDAAEDITPEQGPMTRRRSRSAATPKARTRKTMSKSDARTALAVGTVAVMTGLGCGAYFLVMTLLGQRDIALVVSGFVAGTLTAIVISPAILAGRERAAKVISPRKPTSSTQ